MGLQKKKPIVIMNWSMRQNLSSEAKQYVQTLAENDYSDLDVVILPSMGTIQTVADVIKDTSLQLGAQNIATKDMGELSGEFSVQSLAEMGGSFVELGHWERRQLFNETDDTINQKIKLACDYDISPIVCIGEFNKGDADNVIDEKKDPEYQKKLTDEVFLRLFNSLYQMNEEKLNSLVIAYTPAWAVGESRASSAPHIKRVVKIIRQSLEKIFGEKAKMVRIVYGGTVSLENTPNIIKIAELDGVLVGRFGSQPQRFAEIIQAVRNVLGN